MSSSFKSLSFVLLLLGSVGSAASQATTLPQCALGCARTAASKVGCDLSNTPCLCKASSFGGSVLQCAGTSSCSPAEQAEVSTILTGMCAVVSSSASASSVPASGSGSISVSASVTAPIGSSTPISLTTVTSVVTSVAPPLTTTFTSAVTVVPPPHSIPSSASASSAPSSASASGSATGTTTVIVPPFSVSSPAPSTSPSAGAAVATRAHIGMAGGVGALIGLAAWVL
ncbi:hypothetical protein FB451DRAFT_1264836 [Mycena latifolia]|nr:hypothetical protein FB451DRAFT_1264836 [Mycena latifolia]